MAVDGQFFGLFPAPDGSDFPLEIGGYLFPGIQAFTGRLLILLLFTPNSQSIQRKGH
jgi:hypothetical protein